MRYEPGTEHDPGLARKEINMDFGLLLIVTNTLMAVFIYVLVRLIWQD